MKHLADGWSQSYGTVDEEFENCPDKFKGELVRTIYISILDEKCKKIRSIREWIERECDDDKGSA